MDRHVLARDDRASALARILRRIAANPLRPLFRLETVLWETILGIATIGVDYSIESGEHFCYASIWYREIFRVLRFLELTTADVFVDVGCGKGRVICCAALDGVRAVIGLEDVAALAACARTNAAAMRRRRSSITVFNCRAEEFDYRDATAIYLYNPFGATTLERMLARVADSIAENPRSGKIAYVNPEYEEVLSRGGWLTRYAFWPRQMQRGVEQAVSFWRW